MHATQQNKIIAKYGQQVGSEIIRLYPLYWGGPYGTLTNAQLMQNAKEIKRRENL